MKYIVIKKSESTAALEALGDVEELVFIKVPLANKVTAMNIVNGIDSKNWISSDDVESKKGDISDGILLPKKAIDG